LIGFQLTEEQEQMRQLAHHFADEEIRSVAGDYDESEQMPWLVIEKTAQIRLTCFRYTEFYGGGGVDSLLTTCIVAEELAWGCLGIGMSILTLGPAAIPIFLAGNEQQKSRYIHWFCDTPGKRSAPALRWARDTEYRRTYSIRLHLLRRQQLRVCVDARFHPTVAREAENGRTVFL
jgi:alkylation response protein AidB-like acyl-CoA dehydrogenase